MGLALACRLAEELLHGLAHAHAEGIVHRDVKPHNVLVASDGRAVVADFGIARVLDSDASLTRTGATVGTLAYMAPEQRGSAARVGAPADVYAAAGTLYHLLTGREPLDLYAHRPSAFEQVPQDLVSLLSAAVQYEAEARPTAAQMIDGIAALRRTLGEAPTIDILSTPAPQPRASHSETWSDIEAEDEPGSLATDGPWPVLEAPTRHPEVSTAGTASSSRVLPRAVGAAVFGFLAVGGWWMWPSPDAPVRFDSWEERDAMDLEARLFECSSTGQVAWLRDGLLFSRTAGDVVSEDVGGAERVLFAGDGKLWRIDAEATGMHARHADAHRVFPMSVSGHEGLLLGGEGTRVVGYGPAGMEWAKEGASRSEKLTGASVLTAQLSDDASQVVATLVDEDGLSVTVLSLEDGSRRVLASGSSLLGREQGHVGVAWLGDGRAAWLQSLEGQPPSVYAVDPRDPEATPRPILALDPHTVLMTGSGSALCFVAATQRHVVEVVDVEGLQPIHELVSEHLENFVAGWVDDTRVQLFAQGDVYRVWTPETGALEEGRSWSPAPLPSLAWEPEDLRCTAGICLAMDTDIQGRRFTPVDAESGEAGTPWAARLPESGSGVWELSPDGRVAMITSGGVQVVSADGVAVTTVGLAGLTQVMGLAWAPDGRLWLAGVTEDGGAIVSWTPEEVRLVREVAGVIHPPRVAPDGQRAVLRVLDVSRMELSVFRPTGVE